MLYRSAVHGVAAIGGMCSTLSSLTPFHHTLHGVRRSVKGKGNRFLAFGQKLSINRFWPKAKKLFPP